LKATTAPAATSSRAAARRANVAMPKIKLPRKFRDLVKKATGLPIPRASAFAPGARKIPSSERCRC
jgi:hypothetical protein